MKIIFHLNWLKRGTPPRRAFKFQEAYRLALEYSKRMEPFASCEIQGAIRVPPDAASRPQQEIWVCDHGRGAIMLSSRALSQRLQKRLVSSVREIHIVIGGPDGFTGDDFRKLNPDLHWSFGALTLPHELAAVVACEQVYRAWTILRGLPYHDGH